MAAAQTRETPADYGNSVIEDDEIDLRQYLSIINRYKWGIIGLALFTAIAAALIAYSMEPIYRATTTLLIEPKKQKIVSIEEIYGFDQVNGEYFSTQTEIIRSRELAAKTIDQLKLQEHPDFSSERKGFVAQLRSIIPFGGDSQTQKIDPEIQRQTLIDSFLSRLSVELVRKTQLVKINFETYTPELAKKITNKLAENYIVSFYENRAAASKNAAGWLTERLSELKNHLKQAEQRLQDFRDQENLVDIKGVRTLIAKELDEITMDLVEAKKRRSEAENVLKQINSNRDWTTLPAIVNHPSAQALLNMQAQAENKIAELSKRYGPEHPKMATAKSELASAKNNFTQQVENIVTSIKREFDVAKQNEQSLILAMEQATSRIQEINRKEYKLRELERELEANRKLYDTFFTRYQETTATQDLETSNARIADQAVTPRAPSKPRKKLIVALAFMASLMLGVFIAFLIEALNNSIRSIGDVERYLKLPLLGVVPRTQLPEKQDIDPRKIFTQASWHVIAESIRTIRTALTLSFLNKTGRVILVTSSLPGEGKTTVSSTLAVSLSQLGRVLLIDADMRRPSVGSLFKISKKRPGLSNLVAGTHKASQCLCKLKDPSMTVLPVGSLPPNPLELLASKRFSVAIQLLRKHYDHIIIDSPPVQAVSDALILAKLSDTTVYVVRADETPRQVVCHGIERLRENSRSVPGIVLNHYDPNKENGYYEYYYGYHDYRTETDKKGR